MLEYQNISHVPNWSEEVFVIKKLKTLCRGHTSLVILTEKKLLKYFTKQNSKKQTKEILELEK